MIRIPKIIHQTWKNDKVPRNFQRFSQTWRDMLPGWEYHLWTDEMNRAFVQTHYPEFLERFDTYPNHIQRADAIRYLILQTYGGLYVDMDFECLTPKFASLLEDTDFVAGKEPYEHAGRYGMKYIVCNALMASTPDNPFLKFLIQRMMNHPHGWDVRDGIDILDSTGPFLLTHAYNDYTDKEGIHIIEPQFLYPIRLGEGGLILIKRISEELQRRIDNAYALHYFWGTWWQRNNQRETLTVYRNEQHNTYHTDFLEWWQKSDGMWLRMETSRNQPDVLGTELLFPTYALPARGTLYRPTRL